MMCSVRSAFRAILVACAFAPGALAAQRARPDSATLVTRLGADTLAIERIVRTATRVEAEVVLRVPTTTVTRYVMELSPGGELTRLESTSTDPRSPDGTVRRETMTRAGDSLRVEGGARARAVAASAATLPFIDMVHWPYEVALARPGVRRALPKSLPLLTGARVQEFPLARVGADSVTITHPLRGTMRARVDARGRLLGLDAGATTRKLVVSRRPWMPQATADALVQRWTALDAAGKQLGALSGRAEASGSIGGALVTVDYGTPAARGRAIWGALVPYGAVWRTGANQATHLTTDRDLVFGEGADTVVVPAGRYTLYSIPTAKGGQLIVNRMTGQGGTTYEAAQDVGRVPMTARALATPAETFTIRLEPRDATSGTLHLQWAGAERVVPFRVRAGS